MSGDAAAKPRAKSPRLQNRQAKTRSRLLEAAYRLMSKKGVNDTAIQEITDLADVAFGTFYNYFESKDDIAAQVLDCVIRALGHRNVEANRDAGVTDPILIVANSVRLVAQEMMKNPIWRWWVQRPDLVVERMRDGFKPFGLYDMDKAVEAGLYQIAGDDRETAWSFLIWLLAGGIKDILDGIDHACDGCRQGQGAHRLEAASAGGAKAQDQFRLSPPGGRPRRIRS
jgi:AcrR family transcriptional regulator